MAVAVLGVEQPAADRAGIVSLNQQKSLKYLAMVVGCLQGWQRQAPPNGQSEDQMVATMGESTRRRGPGYVKAAS